MILSPAEAGKEDTIEIFTLHNLTEASEDPSDRKAEFIVVAELMKTKD